MYLVLIWFFFPETKYDIPMNLFVLATALMIMAGKCPLRRFQFSLILAGRAIEQRLRCSSSMAKT